MKLTIWMRCTKCGHIYPSETGYNLRFMYGVPAVCTGCRR